jgi:hypothetical protein
MKIFFCITKQSFEDVIYNFGVNNVCGEKAIKKRTSGIWFKGLLVGLVCDSKAIKNNE